MAEKERKCPECGAKMGKAGMAWSGRQQVQRWRCTKCGRTTTKAEDKERRK